MIYIIYVGFSEWLSVKSVACRPDLKNRYQIISVDRKGVPNCKFNALLLAKL